MYLSIRSCPARKRAETGRLDVTQSDVTTRKATARVGPPKLRREQVEYTLKEIDEERKKASRPPLSTRIQQAGLSWEKRTFFIFSGVVGVIAFVLLLYDERQPVDRHCRGICRASAFRSGCSAFSRTRRETQFIDNFAIRSTSSCAASGQVCRCSIP